MHKLLLLIHEFHNLEFYKKDGKKPKIMIFHFYNVFH